MAKSNGVNNKQVGLKNIIIIEDDWVYSECLKVLFDTHNVTAYQYYSVKSFLEDGLGLLADSDILLLDINLDDKSGLNLVPVIKFHNASIPIVILTLASDYKNIKRAFQLGVCGYLLKGEPLQVIYEQIMLCFENKRVAIAHTALINLIREDNVLPYRTNHFESMFTEREREVISFLEKGLSQKEIASNMHISSGTVNQHLKHIYQKMNVRSKTELLYKIFN